MWEGKSSVGYVVSYPWHRSPEVWKFIVKAVFWGAVIGAVVTACTAGKMMEDKEAAMKAGTTQCAPVKEE
jgi:hypothetical protein